MWNSSCQVIINITFVATLIGVGIACEETARADYVVFKRGSEVRSYPKVTSPPIYTAQTGDQLELLKPSQENGYYKVQIPRGLVQGESIGWAPRTHVRRYLGPAFHKSEVLSYYAYVVVTNARVKVLIRWMLVTSRSAQVGMAGRIGLVLDLVSENGIEKDFDEESMIRRISRDNLVEAQLHIANTDCVPDGRVQVGSAGTAWWSVAPKSGGNHLGHIDLITSDTNWVEWNSADTVFVSFDVKERNQDVIKFAMAILTFLFGAGFLRKLRNLWCKFSQKEDTRRGFGAI